MLNALGLAVASSGVAVLPAFMIGALAVQLEDDLGLTSAGIGMVTASAFVTASVVATRAGAVTERRGADRSMGVACVLAALAFVIVGLATSVAVLLVAMLVGGAANAVAQPASNTYVAEMLPERHLGLALGVKQSSVPLATFVAGISVPIVAADLGWRAACFLVAGGAGVIWAWVGLSRRSLRRADGATPRPDRSPPARRANLSAVAVAGGLAAAAATSAGVFLVVTGLDAGLGPGPVGAVVAAGSLVGIAVRVLWGMLCDRRPEVDLCLLIAVLLAVGAVGLLLLSVSTPATYVVGVFLLFTCSWAWAGLIHLLIVRENPERVAGATGVAQTGLSLGAALGPLLFGAVTDATSLATAWRLNGALAVAAVVVLVLASPLRGRL